MKTKENKDLKEKNIKKIKKNVSIITVFLWIFLVVTMLTIVIGNIKDTNAIENEDRYIFEKIGYTITFLGNECECPIKSLETLPEGFSIKCTISNEEENFNKVYNFEIEDLNYGINENENLYVNLDIVEKLLVGKKYYLILEINKINIEGYYIDDPNIPVSEWIDNGCIYEDSTTTTFYTKSPKYFKYLKYGRKKTAPLTPPTPLDLYNKTITMVCNNNSFHNLKPLGYRLAYSDTISWSKNYCQLSDVEYNGSNFECILTINVENWLSFLNKYLKSLNKNINFDHVLSSCDNKMTFIYDEESKTWISDKDQIIIYAEDPEERNTYNVYYQWEGLPNTNDINIPYDNNIYMENDKVSVDEKYIKGTVVNVNNVEYIFSGWKIDDIDVPKENEILMPSKDVIIRGIWREKNIKDEQKNIKVEKIWEDNNNEYGKRAESVILQIKNKDKIVEEILVDEKNNWSYEFLLPKYDEEGKEIEYTVDERETSKYYEKVIDGYRVINKYVGEEKNESDNDIIKNEENVNTSDINVWMYVGISIISIVVIVVVIILVKKNRNENK